VQQEQKVALNTEFKNLRNSKFSLKTFYLVIGFLKTKLIIKTQNMISFDAGAFSRPVNLGSSH
jgi:hypothetical protein